MARVKLRNPKLKSREELLADIASFIGEGVHTALRKYVDSKESAVAWKAIRDLPRGEWGVATSLAAEVIVDYLRDDCGLTEIGSSEE